MIRSKVAVCFSIIGVAQGADAAEYLTVVTSEVYQVPGTPKDIATRASTCISQHLAAGTTDSQLIISSDLDGGVIVARNAIEYGGMVRWQIRSRFTLEAKEGRFRIEQTGLERFTTNSLTGASGWGPIGKWAGSGSKKAEEMFVATATTVARCVIDGPNKTAW